MNVGRKVLNLDDIFSDSWNKEQRLVTQRIIWLKGRASLVALLYESET